MSGKQGECCMGVVFEGECMGRFPEDEPLTLRCYSCGCHSFMNSWKGGNPSVAKPTT